MTEIVASELIHTAVFTVCVSNKQSRNSNFPTKVDPWLTLGHTFTTKFMSMANVFWVFWIVSIVSMMIYVYVFVFKILCKSLFIVMVVEVNSMRTVYHEKCGMECTHSGTENLWLYRFILSGFEYDPSSNRQLNLVIYVVRFNNPHHITTTTGIT